MLLSKDQKRRVRELIADEGHRCSNCGGELANVGEVHKLWGEERYWISVGCENRDGSSLQFFVEGEQAEYIGLAPRLNVGPGSLVQGLGTKNPKSE